VDVTNICSYQMDVTQILWYKVGVSKTDVPVIGGRADGAGGRACEPVRGALPLRRSPQHAAPPGTTQLPMGWPLGNT
jgi:hypothetical protein